MTEKGIKETSDFVVFVCRLANTVSSVLADGKVSIVEYPSLFMLIPHLVPAIQGAKEIPAELADLSETEVYQLTDLVKKELKLTGVPGNIDAIAAQFVFATFTLIKAIHDLIELTKKEESEG